MAVNNNYQTPKKPVSISYDFLDELRKVVRNLVNGKTNNTGEVTLTASVTSTIVPNILCNANSVITLQAITADAAGAISGLYVVPGDEQFTIHHPSSASANKVFRYVVTG